MEDNRAVVILYLHKQNRKIDVDIPLYITANELIVGLNKGFCLEMDTENLSGCYLKAENPICLIKGNKTLKEIGIINGTIIHYTL